MAEPISKTQRWLDLIAFLIGYHYPVPVERIMEAVPAYAAGWASADETARASARRKFERDKDELREMGIPIDTVPYSIGHGGEQQEGYRLSRRDFYLPYLRIVGGEGAEAAGEPARASGPGASDGRTGPSAQKGAEELDLSVDEAAAALDALGRVSGLPAFPFAREARSAFRKLAGDLDPDAFRSTPLLYLDRRDSEEARRALRALADALRDRKRVRFTYHGIYRDETTEREVAPYGLFFQGGNWYLAGHDADRDDLRVFRISRLEDLEVNAKKPRKADYEVPPDFRVEEWTGREAWELGPEDEGAVEARVLFRFPVSLWAARNRHGALEEERENGDAIRSFHVRQVSPFLRWLLTFEGEAELLSPPELRRELRELAGSVAALYGTDSGESAGHG